MRRQNRQADSLDLLLDTICNAFGGILFVAMLVLLLLRMSPDADVPQVEDEASPASRIELAALHERLAAELQAVEESIKNVMQQAGQFASANTKPLVDQLRSLREQRDVAQQELDQTKQQVRAVSEDVDSTKKEIQDLETTLVTLRRKLADESVALQTETKSRTRGGGLPLLRDTDKAPITIVMRYGRFYVWHRYGPWFDRIGLNTDDFVVLEETTDELLTAPKPFGGVPADSSDESRLALSAELEKFPPSRVYLNIALWPDSYDSFQQVRPILVEGKFEYNFYLAREGDQVHDRGAPNQGVQ